MRPDRALAAALRRAAGLTAVLLALLVFHAPFPGLAVRAWLVALAAVFAWAVAGPASGGWIVGERARRRLRWAWWRRDRPERVRGLEEVEHAVDFSLATAFDLHYRLRPHLVRIAAHRLALRGVSLEAQPDRARRLLGSEAWEVVRPDRPAPESRSAPGIELRRLRRVVESLDAL